MKQLLFITTKISEAFRKLFSTRNRNQKDNYLSFKKSGYATFICVALVMLLTQAGTAQIYLNTFTGASACPTNGNTPAMAANSTGAPLSRTTITCNSTANVFNSTTLNNTASISNTSYIEFSATANAGFQLSVTSLTFFRQASASAPNQLEVRYSTDGFATSTSWGAAPVSPTTGANITWDFTDFITPIAGTVTFRFYPYGTTRADLVAGASAASGTFRLDDVTLNGTVTTPAGVPTHLAVTTINGGSSPSATDPFSVIVQAQDGGNSAANVTANTNFTISLATGSGSLGGTLTGTISAATSQVTVSAVTYSIAQAGVSVTATRTSGDVLTAGTSATFTVLGAVTQLVYVSLPSSGLVNTNLSTFTVEARRADNSVDLNYTSNVVLSLNTGTGAVSGTVTKPCVAGVATFNDIQFSTSGSKTLLATSGSVTAVSSSISITVPQYVAGNLAVLVAASSSATNTTASIVELNTSTAAQSAVSTYSINGAGANALRFSGSAASSGYLANSDDGTLLCIAGHNNTNTSSNANTLNPRGVGTLDQNFTFALPTTYTGVSGNQVRCATTVDNTSWYIGEQGGVYTNGSTTPSPSGNFRGVKSFGGVVYSQSTAAVPIGTLSAPSGGTLTALPGLTASSTNLQDFYLVSSGGNNTYDILYLLYTANIDKYSLVSGSWTSNGSYVTSGGFGLAAKKQGTGANLYVSTGSGSTAANSVVKLFDAAGFNSTINITTANNVTLYTTGAGTTVKGVAFAPAAPTGIPDHLTVLSVNSGNSPSATEAFSIVVQTRDVTNHSANVAANTNVTLSLATGSGTLGGTLTGTINAGSNIVTITGVTYSIAQTGVSVTATRTSGDVLTAGTSALFNVLGAATQVAFVNFPTGGAVSTPVPSFTVEVRRADNTVDLNYSGSVSLSLNSGPGSISGTTTAACVLGVSTFNNVMFSATGIYTLLAQSGSLSTQVSSSISILSPVLTEVLVPQYIQGVQPTNTNRTPYAYLVTLSGLLPNVTYRYINQVVTSADAATASGSGNILYSDPSAFYYSASPDFITAGNYGQLATDATGSYTGWFITIPTGNARFTPGADVLMRIRLNDGAGGTSPVMWLSTTSPTHVINFGTAATNGTALRGNSNATGKNFVAIYDNVNGTGRPVAASMAEFDGYDMNDAGNIALYYLSDVELNLGTYGMIIPNTLPNGIRRVEQRARVGGGLVGCPNTDADGVWPSGVNTVNPTSGGTALALTATDAPLSTTTIITATPGANGTITPTGAVTVTCGNSQTFAISGNTCYHVLDVVVDGSSVGAVASYTFTNVLAPHTISATFAANAAPTIGSCPSDITTCNPVVTFSTPTSTGVPTPTVTCVPASGSTFSVGTTVVTCTANNGCGSPSCSFNVIVNSAPVIGACPSNITTCNPVVTFSTPSATGTPTPSVSCSPASGSTFSVGTTAVTCTATNSCGSSSCSFNVTVNEAPVIGSCPSDITTCNPVVTFATPSATGTPTPSVSCSPASGSTFFAGDNTVTCTATNTCGSSSCSFNVHINSAPVIGACPADITQCNPVATWTDPTSTGDPAASVTCSPASGSTFAAGDNTVTCTATNVCGSSSCSFNVHINSAPVIGSCPADITQCNPVATWTDPTSTGDPAATVTCSPASGSTFATGDNTVTCTATNVCGSSSCSFNVHINSAPVIGSCPADITQCDNHVATWTTPSATGDPAPSVSCSPASGSTFAAGTTTVTCTATNVCGSSSCSFSVTINDSPVIGACPGNITTCNPVVTFSTPSATGTPAPSVSCSPASGSTFAAGTTTVTCTATNTCGSSSCSFTVTVNTPSTAATSATSNALYGQICLGNQVTLTANGGSLGTGAVWVWYEGGCGVGASVGTGASITIQPATSGAHQYCVRAEGACGNTACQCVTVTVNTAPPTNTIHYTATLTDGCVGAAAQTISVNAVANCTFYNWTSGDPSVRFNGNPGPFQTTTPTVNVTFVALPPAGASGWSICVFGGNSCGNTNNICTWARATLSIPTAITGSIIGCPGTSGNAYSSSAIAGAATYQWTGSAGITVTGNGAQAVTVAFSAGFVSGTLSVHGQTSCGYNGVDRTITINRAPATPGAIVGTSYPCPSASTVFSVGAVTGAASYTWTTSVAGAVVTGTTTSCSIAFPAIIPAGSTISVTANSSCPYSSAVRSKGIASGLPGTPGNISGPAAGQCGQTGVGYSISPVSNATGYSWSTACGTIVGPTNLSGISMDWPNNMTSCVITVTSSNACGSSGARTLAVGGAPNAPTAITGNTTAVCAGSVEQYCAAGSNGATAYIWTVPAGATILGPSNGACVLVQWGATGGTLTAKGVNDCGTSASKSQVATMTCRQGQVNSIVESLHAEVYPNPATEKATVKFAAASAGQYHLNMTDVLGQNVLSIDGAATEGVNMIELNLNSLAKGVYMLNIMSDDNAEQIRVVVE